MQATNYSTLHLIVLLMESGQALIMKQVNCLLGSIMNEEKDR